MKLLTALAVKLYVGTTNGSPGIATQNFAQRILFSRHHNILVLCVILSLNAMSDCSAQERPIDPYTGLPLVEPTRPSTVDEDDYRAYRLLVSKLSPEEQAWERMLEKYHGKQFFPRHVRNRLEGRSSPWDFVRPDPNVPSVMLIGDSISGGYTLPLRKRLQGKANLYRAPANTGPTTSALVHLEDWLGVMIKWDLIVFNFGLHDRKRDPKEYADNLEQIVKRMKKTGARLLWVQTTPYLLKEDPDDAPVRGKELNAIADEVMKRNHVEICPLFEPISEQRSKLWGGDRLHFGKEGSEAIADIIARSISSLLASESQTPSE